MNQFLNSILNQDIETPLIIFLMLFSLGIAIFHTVIFSGLFEIKIKGWFFFVFNPSVIGITALLYRNAVFLVFITMFLSVFALGIIGMIYGMIKDSFKEAEKNERFYRQYNIKPETTSNKILKYLGSALLILLFVFSGFYFFFIILGFIILQRFLPSNRNRFLKLQSVLPTSKIHTVAMGLAEVRGNIKYKEAPLLAPIRDRECIGFTYKIEKISRDKDGKESFQTIFNETKINRFYIEDETGKIEVNPEQLEFIKTTTDDEYSSGGKRFSQYLIEPDDKMLLVGKVALENNTPVFEYESIKKVFAIMPVAAVEKHNENKPLVDSLFRHTAVFVFMIALVLITPVKIKNNTIYIGKPEFKNPLQSVDSFDDFMNFMYPDKHKEPTD
ncbi:hypothetical protein [Flavobacterium sp. H122]|uniref:hypothetical protein n=1 Tax=Flavobacterium sp. H122 TaxID=2529860 RepID=UPI0010AB31B2|nr:hypothetical protein [Flavobacterium sp. H122]